MAKAVPGENQIALFDGLPSHTGDVKALRVVKNLAHTTIVPERFVYVQTDSQIDECVALVRAVGACAIDCETTGTGWRDRSVAFSITTGWLPNELKSFFIPTDMVYAKRNFTAAEIREAFEGILADPKILKVNHNIKFDMHKLRRAYGIEEFDGIHHDTMTAAWILDENDEHDLGALCKKYLDVEPWKLKNDGKFQLWPINVAINYNCSDTENTFKLYEFQRFHLEKLPNLHRLMYEIEMPNLRIVYDMERRGVAWDAEYANTVMRPEIEKALAEAESECRKYMGNINLRSDKQVAAVLYDGLKLPRQKVRKKDANGNDIYVETNSTAKKILAKIRHLHPVVTAFEKFRKFDKIKQAFSDTLPEHVEHGRIHCTYNTIVRTGRMSCKAPNLQQLPKSSVGPIVRRAFVPSPGCVLVTMDYSQIELRLLAHHSDDPTMIDVFKNDKDIHSMTCSGIFKIPLEELEADKKRPQENPEYVAARTKSKNVNFGIPYGIGPNGLMELINAAVKRDEDKVDLDGAQAIIDGFGDSYPYVGVYKEKQKKKARRLGYVETIFGRKRRLPDARSSDRRKSSYAERQAGNSPIQGSAADIIKVATVKIDQFIRDQHWPFQLLLQIHDELVMEVPLTWLQHNRSALDVLAKMFAGVVTLKVPLKTSVEVLTRWGDKLPEDALDIDEDDEDLIA